MKKLTQERLKELFFYDPLVGDFVRRINIGHRVKKGDIAGSNYSGYLMTMIDGKRYLNHILAWLYVYGYFPENDIDHKDQIKHHNWISNLRETSKQCNMRNCKTRTDNTSGIKGICWDKRTKRWFVSMTINTKHKYLGRYKNFENAVCARLAGEQCLNWSNCDSSSPAYQYVQNNILNKRTSK
jgi:hypothetical protein